MATRKDPPATGLPSCSVAVKTGIVSMCPVSVCSERVTNWTSPPIITIQGSAWGRAARKNWNSECNNPSGGIGRPSELKRFTNRKPCWSSKPCT